MTWLIDLKEERTTTFVVDDDVTFSTRERQPRRPGPTACRRSDFAIYARVYSAANTWASNPAVQARPVYAMKPTPKCSPWDTISLTFCMFSGLLGRTEYQSQRDHRFQWRTNVTSFIPTACDRLFRLVT